MVVRTSGSSGIFYFYFLSITTYFTSVLFLLLQTSVKITAPPGEIFKLDMVFCPVSPTGPFQLSCDGAEVA